MVQSIIIYCIYLWNYVFAHIKPKRIFLCVTFCFISLYVFALSGNSHESLGSHVTLYRLGCAHSHSCHLDSAIFISCTKLPGLPLSCLQRHAWYFIILVLYRSCTILYSFQLRARTQILLNWPPTTRVLVPLPSGLLSDVNGNISKTNGENYKQNKRTTMDKIRTVTMTTGDVRHKHTLTLIRSLSNSFYRHRFAHKPGWMTS